MAHHLCRMHGNIRGHSGLSALGFLLGGGLHVAMQSGDHIALLCTPILMNSLAFYLVPLWRCMPGTDETGIA